MPTKEWDFDQTQWELTDNGVEYDYDEVFSPDDTRVLGYDKLNRAYLRWPLKGAWPRKARMISRTGVPYINLDPVEEPGAPAAN